MRFARSLGLFLVGFGLLSASAQAKPGDHIKFGKTVITPSLAVGFQVRSNAFRAETQAQAGGNLSFTPAIAAAIDTPDLVFNLQAAYTARKFVFLGNPQGFGDEVRRTQLKALDRFNSFTGGVAIDGFRTRQVGIKLSDRAVVQNNPNDGADIEGDHPYVSQIRNTLGGGLAFRPGPALQIGLNGAWTWSRFFLPSATSPRAVFNTRNSYGPKLQVRWLFLPRTAWVFNASYTYNNWVQEDQTIGDLQTPDSHFIRADTGLQGRVTTRLNLIARVGYGAGLFKEGDGTTLPGGLLATLQATYTVTEAHAISLGYRKSFFDSYFTNVTQANSLYARWKGKYGERLTSELRYGLRFEGYRGSIARQDVLNQLNAKVNYDVARWFNIGLNGGWLQRRSSDNLVEYDDIRGGLSMRFSY